ncbi:MAG TPA: ATP-binding protein, partial [Thiomicrospira sp.]|nr:ATP-binding protein [Thiomicrospira sp.]
MNNNQTIEKLKQMRIKAMAELHMQHITSNSVESYTPDQYLAILTDHEWESRQNQKIERLIKQASFRQNASIEEVNFEPERNLERNMFNRL